MLLAERSVHIKTTLQADATLQFNSSYALACSHLVVIKEPVSSSMTPKIGRGILGAPYPLASVSPVMRLCHRGVVAL
jgi:hypothetical protein